MTDHPMLFSPPMILALLREAKEPGTGKTQTRRTFSPTPERSENGSWIVRTQTGFGAVFGPDATDLDLSSTMQEGLRIQPGDRVWCRETWHAARSLDSTPPRDIPRDADIEYAATARSYAEIGLKGKKRPGMFLPRWASRLTLYVTEVRVQRLQDISEADARAEGVVCLGRMDGEPWDHCHVPGVTRGYEDEATTCYSMLWEHLNGPGSWQANPFVAAYTFRPVLGNIDTLPSTLEAA